MDSKALEKYNKLMRQRREASTRHYNKKWKQDPSTMSAEDRQRLAVNKKIRSAKQLAYYYTKKAESLSC
tara:strand:+ start:207 stop:413 length:207 start_codon:yes stop_codon:yes gene_type:complete